MSKKIGPAERLQKEGKGPVSLSANLKNRAKKLRQINPNMKNPQKAHNGPFMMAPGSKEVDSPGPFRDDSKAVMFYGKPQMNHPMMKHPMMKHPMMKHPMNVKPDFPDVDGDGDKKEPISKAQKDLQAQKKPQMGGMMKPNDYHK